MAKTTITKDRVRRLVTVEVKQTSKRCSDPDDGDLNGAIYHIEINKGVPKKIWAGVALDVFHRNVSVGCLEDFEFTVKDGQKEISEPDDYESYSGEYLGQIQ